ncbi:AAA family ATPase [Curvibacter sp. HBC61]|uniref:AAA family ATPase n=1 Tax=Curvibacter cyanobacteriorum TaxID=3026422 RepID=A0ABT5N2J5_9BURK|nr:AAA family ATPase [Curvibacter sp. HBC61]MDD0840302.1 AAA family ATPase [Curvibacter sp. HBC61]
MLGFLAAHTHQVLRRETLAEMLWADLPAHQARAQLREVLGDLASSLHRLGLGTALEVQRDWLTLKPEGVFCTDLGLLARPQDAALWSRAQREALLGSHAAGPDAWLAQAEDGCSDDFREWLRAQRLHLHQALAQLHGEQAARGDAVALGSGVSAQRPPAAPPPGPVSDRPRRPETAPGAAPQARTAPQPEDGLAVAPQIAHLTLLRLEFDEGPDSDPQRLLQALPTWLDTVRSEAEAFDGVLVDYDDAGGTLAFGLDSQHTGQRWQALRCAASLSDQLAPQRQLRMAVTAGRSLLQRGPQPRVQGWRRSLIGRLVWCAEVGELVCDDSFIDLVAQCHFEPQGPRQFRGLNREVTVYRRALGDHSAPWLLPPGGDLAGLFLGREAALHRLGELLAALGSGPARALCLSGEPGMGKTRVAWEFARHCQGLGHAVFWLGARPEAVDVPWRGLSDLFSGLLSGTGDRAQQLERTARRCGAELSAEARAAILGLLHSRSVPQGARPALAEGLGALLRGAGPGPHRTLLVVDDVQWLDTLSADLLNRVAQQGAPVLWLLTQRRGQRQPLPLAGLETLELEALDDASAEAILSALPDADLLSPEARRGRIANARGLPLYLLADSVPSDHGSHFSEFCQALLNRLGDARAPMAAAAVFGMLFSIDDLATLCGPDAARQACERALASGLLVARGTHQASFFHPRLREHLLSVTPLDTLQHHAQQAAALLQARRQFTEAAVLWEQAQRPHDARNAWFLAAQTALAEDDICAACNSSARLAQLGYLDGPAGLRARVLHANALIARDGYGSSAAHALMSALPSDDPQADGAEALDQDTHFAVLALRYLAASGQSHADGLPAARALQDSACTPAQHYIVQWAMGHSLFWLGRFEEAQGWFDQSMALGATLSLAQRMAYFPSDPAVFARAELAWMQWLRGEPALSQQTLADALRLADLSTTRQDPTIAHCFAALLAWLQGDRAWLAQHATRGFEMAEAEGFTFWRAVAGLLVALGQAEAGASVDFIPLAKQADTVLLGYQAATTTALWFACAALLASQQPALALQLLGQMLGQSGPDEHLTCRMDLHRLQAEALQQLQRSAEAQAAWQQALAVAAQAGAHGWLRRWAERGADWPGA